MNKHLICLGFAVIVALTGVVSAGTYSGGGDGTAEQPYRISTAADMNEIGANWEDWGSHFVMVNDIDLAEYTGTQFNVIGEYYRDRETREWIKNPFTGVFDGNGHTINNFTYETTSAGYFGIFWYVDDVNAVIKDLTLTDPNVEAWHGWGGTLVGRLGTGTITGCGVDGGSVSGRGSIGGLVGTNAEGTIENCYATTNIEGEAFLGGLVGENDRGTIKNCYATGSVSGLAMCIGGLVGGNSRGTIENCYATGNVFGLSPPVGGLVGDNREGTIKNCYATGNVSGGTAAGGLVGANEDGTIENCYATGSVSGISPADRALPATLIGGLMGLNRGGSIDNCYATGSVDGNDVVGGLVGGNSGTIENCRASGRVTADTNVGGLVGENNEGTIVNCCAAGSVDGNDVVATDFASSMGTRAGGLVGVNREGTISNCYAIGSVSGVSWVGGLVGFNYSGMIESCYAEGNVTGSYEIGGLVGDNGYGRISNCYAAGSVTGGGNIGGLMGFNYKGTISNCYAAGIVDGNDFVGGLTGYDYRDTGDYTKSFWDKEVNPDVNGIGNITDQPGVWDKQVNPDVNGIGNITDPPGVIGESTANMQKADTFIYAGWSICGNEEVWTIDEGNDYPRLSWQNLPGQPLPSFAELLQGTGSEEKPYLVRTAGQLNLIGLSRCEWDKHFKLVADIDLSIYTGTQFNIIGTFTGVFDGNGHTISNFTYTTTNTNCIGLFGYVDDANAAIKNLTLVTLDVNAAGESDYVGSLVGWLQSGTVTGCGVEGGSVSGTGNTGGLVGDNDRGTISNCYAAGNVSGEGHFTGGLVGENYGTISNCYAAGNVSGEGHFTGGLVGGNGGRISNCYATGRATGDYYTGGLVGGNWGWILNCYAAGRVVADANGGGLVGYNGQGTISASFWDIEIGGPDNGIGTGLPTSQMQTMSTFTDAGWDFVTPIWKICEDNDYPRLWWEECPEPIEAELWIFPRVIVRHSRQKNILAWIRLPEGVDKEQIDSNEPILLWPGEIEAVNQYVIEHGPAAHKRTSILAFFKKAELMDAVVYNGEVEVEAVGSLTSGRYFYGSDTVLIKTRRYRPSRRWR